MKSIVFLACAGPLLAADPVSFYKQIQPLLAERCQMCHSSANRSGKLALDAYVSVLGAVKPGNPTGSALIAYVSGPKPLMPKAGAPLTPEQTALLRTWIEQGAKDDSPAGKSVPEVWWSRQPMKRITPPAEGHPVDAFIHAKLRDAKLTPSPEADRRTLIRRVTFDLTGLPPTPAEVDAFLADTKADAYERLVDRLLASPRYGERWARHWLDVVHYGDSHGYDKDKPRLNAWPYRDWVIRAFNDDMPYRRFVKSQLAGDVLYPNDPQATVATGFIAAGPWDFVGHAELVEGTTEKNNTRVLDRDDMVATTMSTFVSTTAHCARCHDHKFDPIKQEDYYSLQAVFAGVDRADRAYDADPSLNRQRQQLIAQRKAVQVRLQPLLDKVDAATSPEIERLDLSIKDAKMLAAHIADSKLPADIEQRKVLLARAAEQSQARKLLVDALVGPAVFEQIAQLTAEAKQADDAIAKLPPPQWIYAVASYFPRTGTFRPPLEPRPVHVLNRGSVSSPGKLVQAGTIGERFALADPQDEGARRAALARWITADDNPLTWRSIVNRVWLNHFGAGLVDSPSDFGRMGMKPSHPELLDYLAVWFRDDAHGSLKQLHRLLVTSAAYRQSSAQREDGAVADADNRLLWRMNRTRLDAESLHDAVLSAAGKLDLTMGGPGVRQFWFKDDHSPVYDYARYDVDSSGGYRRSIYRFLVRSVPDPLMDRLDCPDPSVLAPKRSTTITAIQALALFNNPFIVRMSEHLAARVEHEGGMAAAYRLVLGRDPGKGELEQMNVFAAQHGLPAACRVLLNTNEFAFVD